MASPAGDKSVSKNRGAVKGSAAQKQAGKQTAETKRTMSTTTQNSAKQQAESGKREKKKAPIVEVQDRSNEGNFSLFDTISEHFPNCQEGASTARPKDNRLFVNLVFRVNSTSHRRWRGMLGQYHLLQTLTARETNMKLLLQGHLNSPLQRSRVNGDLLPCNQQNLSQSNCKHLVKY